MALTDEMGTSTTMLVQPSGIGNMNNGFGDFGNGGAFWILLLFILLGNGAWGNGFGGGFGGGNELYPWMNQSNQINGGFRDQMINSNIDSIQAGINGIQTQLCNGFAGVEQGANTRQIADMQQAFAAQTAMSQGFNTLGSQFANCCCDNRLATCQTQNIVQNEGNATRFADANNTRDIIESQTRSTQAILDKLCALELDGVKNQLAQAQRENVGLQNQLNMATMQNGMNNEVDALYNRLKNCPVPSMPVYGMTPIFTCPNNSGCGCGCGGSF